MSTENSGAPKYSIGFVAFIDILGWAELVDASANDQASFDRVYDIVAAIKGHADSVASGFSEGVRIKQCSDSILVTVNISNTSQRPEKISLFSCLIARECFSRGLLVRGGITIGEFYHDGDALFGPAVTRAYYIEKSVSLPIIAIDPSPIVVGEFLDADEYGFHVANWADDGSAVGYERVSISPLARLASGTYFVDWMRDDISDHQKYRPHRVYSDEEKSNRLNELWSAKSPISVRPKIDWFRIYARGEWRSTAADIQQIEFKNINDVARWVKSDDYFEQFRQVNLKSALVRL